MSRIEKLILACLALALAFGLRGVSAYAQMGGQADLGEMIATAKTPADHEAIAKQYDTLAAQEKSKAEMHKRMGQNYKQVGGAPVGKYNLVGHCDNLSKNATKDAAEYEKLAAAHRDMAKQAP